MRRIIACVLVLGVAGLGGVGVMRGIAQSEPSALKPEQLKPTNYGFSKNPAATSPTDARPDILIPDLPEPVMPAPDNLPILAPSEAKPAVHVPAPMVIPPTPALVVPVPPVVSPMPVATTEEKPVAPPQIIDPKKLPETTFVNPTPSTESVKPVTPASTGAKTVPAVSLETIAPESAPFGQPVTYEIVVKNAGQHAVTHVRVDEELGDGAKFISAEPAGETNDDKLMWMLGTLSAGEEKHIKVTVKPGDGDLATKPRVTYTAASAMNVRITRPNLVVTVSAAEAVQIGDEVPVQIQVTNNGTGEAPKILLKALLTDGLKHPEGNDIQALLSKLAPGESQSVTLRMQAATPGSQNVTLFATSEAPKATAQAKLDVRQPKLNLAVSGPSKCMVKAEPVFTLEVSNPGTSATEPVQLAVAFPEGLDFGTASDGGAYDPATRTVSWNLGSANAGTKRNLSVKMKSSVAGHLAVRAVAQAGPKLSARAEAVIQAEGVPAMLFEVTDLEDPIEVDKETTYEIRIANTGTMHCTNVKLTAALSDGLISGVVSSTVPHKVVGQTLVFEPIAKLALKADLVIRVKAKGTTPGDHRFKVQLSCDQLKQPVIKEESTSFFQP